ncbi:monovalent cation/H+ antiporter subunit D [Candidatus Contendibacter odensensis]|uniref:PH adaptation potassium efflux system D transmembrane protein n=1 Tax=Candidatus Contendobacter odensis Run_B_J11 TaxID=1400861 RepID=A0A7U7GAQ3_9GAMM|nr:monovalent cation/H+ antiporter subunit D [Candidatus Contendobacter odensis]CDH44706.1 pH adaptation potassium efflux system D transmembrane protein [Candidatus Contendobacter odensis Run_B_J11]
MDQRLILPILLPFIAGIVLLLTNGMARQRRLSITAVAALLPLAAALLAMTGDGYHAYVLGNWPAPFGIVLVLDRLSALMLGLTALVALPALLYAVAAGTDAQGRYFHPLFQFQLMGLNGAFLTGDLFNLFVFFEILLIASYSLLLHGGGRERIRAGLHYVILNLVGSALFLIAIGTLYGMTGALNLADLAVRIAAAPAADAGLLRTGALLLLVVFGLKAAMLPLYFWLPAAYTCTSAPVAALFALLTKVGVYSIIRVFSLAFGPTAGVAANVAMPWLLPLALATLLAGGFGVLASWDSRRLIAYSVIVSIGTLLAGIGLGSTSGLSAALVYLVHTTLITAGMFLLADLIAMQRGHSDSRPSSPVAQPLILGTLFFVGAVAMAGMPPLSGFLGKVLLLRAAEETVALPWIWSVVLGSSLLIMVAWGRMGSSLFWNTLDTPVTGIPVHARLLLPAVALLAAGPLLMVLARPLTHFAAETAQQIFAPAAYIETVLANRSLVPATGTSP